VRVLARNLTVVPPREDEDDMVFFLIVCGIAELVHCPFSFRGHVAVA
jgi:hypothetical protein